LTLERPDAFLELLRAFLEEVGETPTARSARTMAAGEAREPLRWVALGDSYTIGTATHDERERWPNQLVDGLASRGHMPGLALVANLAVNGYTSRDVVDLELPALDEHEPEFVSLLIGVNDVVQGVPASTYEANVGTILDELLRRLPASRIVAVSTPDYTVTPQGPSYGDPSRQAAGILQNNEILRRLAGARGIPFVDIYDLSLQAAADRSLVADDGLHPSGAQYAAWVQRIGPVVAGMLADAAGPADSADAARTETR
ncbi:MAG TPA: SGNH/GDSL hydrolase family protein, partial [Candidatus Limnocylindrales bacterium]|nr:SGNH/GDSL hydrolase family protein [Candidatus Limnocylindrales bacterium]